MLNQTTTDFPDLADPLVCIGPLFKKDSAGRVRMWDVEVDTSGGAYRTIYGIVGSENIVTGAWTQAVGKNIGKKNETTVGDQAMKEALAALVKREKEGYARTVEASGAGFFDPMLAHPYEEKRLKGQSFIFYQRKIDGMRGLARADGIWTRTGERINTVPHIEEQLAPIFKAFPDLILDGELYNHEMHEDFEGLIGMLRTEKPTDDELEISRNVVQFHVYDCCITENYYEIGNPHPVDSITWNIMQGDLVSKFCLHPDDLYTHRLEFLQEVLFYDQPLYVFDHPTGRLTPNPDGTFDQDYIMARHDEYKAECYEGLIIRLDAPYQIGSRTHDLLKLKVFDDTEFPIVDILEGKGKAAGKACKIVCRLPDGRTFKATKKGKDEDNRAIYARKEDFIGKQCTVQHFGYTKYGIPRHTIAKALHERDRA